MQGHAVSSRQQAFSHNVVQPPRIWVLGFWYHHSRVATGPMPAVYNVDIKLSFEQFDMTPGEAGRKFRRNLMQAPLR